MYPFKKARLNDCNGDLSKRWYIEFYAWDVQKEKLVRKRFYEINNYATEKDRRNYARRIIREINDLLDEGYHFDINKIPPEAESKDAQSYTFEEAIQHALDIKKPSLRPASYPSYKSTVELFKEWARQYRISTLDVVYFDKLRAVYFDDYLFIECGFSATTVNGHISYLKSLFQALVDREIILNNPFKNLKKHKESESTKNLAFSEDQITQIKKIIEKENPELWLFIQFIYYCFMRPNEIRQLEQRHIHLNDKKIFIPSSISKNGKDGYVTILTVFANATRNKYFFIIQMDMPLFELSDFVWAHKAVINELDKQPEFGITRPNLRFGTGGDRKGLWFQHTHLIKLVKTRWMKSRICLKLCFITNSRILEIASIPKFRDRQFRNSAGPVKLAIFDCLVLRGSLPAPPNDGFGRQARKSKY